MVANKSRKKARQRQLEQAKKDERRNQTESAVFGDYENDEIVNDEDDPDSNGVTFKKVNSNEGIPEAANDSQPAEPKAAGDDAQAKAKTAASRKKKQKAEGVSSEDKKAARFICFVGRLPFTATNESITKHFARIQPSAVRHATSKETGKSRGFAFLEFDRFERMKDCLRLYHHSMFDDGLGGEPRRINIELTAGGGGGKSKERKDRIRQKNEKLTNERVRRAKASKGKPAGEEGQRGGDGNGQEPVRVRKFRPTGANADPTGGAVQDGSIHPSRLARLSR